MNRILRLFFCVSLLAAPCLGAGTATVVAETEIPEETVVSTIPTMATEPAASQPDDAVPIPEKETEPSKDKLEDVPEPEATNESEEEEEKSDKQPTTKGASSYAITLIEGVDIDADFAGLIRTNKQITNNGQYWSGYGKGQDQLTDADMEALTWLYVRDVNPYYITSLKGIEYATNLEWLVISSSGITTFDVSNQPLLTYLSVANNNQTSLDVSQNPLLTTLHCMMNKVTSLDISNQPLLTYLLVRETAITSLDISQNPLLTNLTCMMLNNLTSVDVSNNPLLTDLTVSYCSSVTSLDISQNPLLTRLDCQYSKLTSIDVSNQPSLIHLNIMGNQIVSLDVSANPLLEVLYCGYNRNSYGWSLSQLDLSDNTSLKQLYCQSNYVYSLDLSNNPLLEVLNIEGNMFKNLNFLSTSDNPLLKSLDCGGNQISDITGIYGFTNLTNFYAPNQRLSFGVPPIIGGNATVDLLKTSASKGLSLSNISIGGSPILTPNGDKIELSNVTYADLENKVLGFSFSGSDLIEGASSGSKTYYGEIQFSPASFLESSLGLTPEDKKKVESGGTVAWNWTIKNISPVKAENIHATLTLPTGLVIDPSSINRNGVSASLSDIDGTTNLGDLAQGETLTFGFNTTATGNANEWLKATGQLDWIDQNPDPKTNQTDGSVQIKDDEQTYTPKTQEDMALLSVPESFRFGFWDVKNTAQTVSLHSSNYLTNTEVVSEGFYTRLRDDRAVNNGWKLSAQLSDFKDSTSEVMPNSAGTSLRMQDMSIESIVDRDTPAEAIDPTPTGVPSTVLTDETLVAGQTAKPLVTAGTGEGAETWQLRIPFDKVSLQLPANAGKKNTYYSATLTWSLDDTP
ncbi:WxL domain-containing protein [Enterococcus sp. AZ007]|uniref:WxL domain-containing protein n=1 Tax=Enterococcus sp. AZ007 TaxID=2774839 RepID=UPI003F1F0407